MALPVVSMGLPRPWISVSDTEHQINPIKGDDSRKLSEWVSLCKIKRGGQTLQGGWWAATVSWLKLYGKKSQAKDGKLFFLL